MVEWYTFIIYPTLFQFNLYAFMQPSGVIKRANKPKAIHLYYAKNTLMATDERVCKLN
jgi:hypothetical protein